MGTFFVLLSFVAFIVTIVGLIKPVWLKQSTRGKVLLWYGGAFLLLFIIGVSFSSSENPTPTQQADMGTQPAPAAQAPAPEVSSTPSPAPAQQAATPTPAKTVPAPVPKSTPVLQPAPAPQPQTVLDISGSGSKSTQTFTVGNNWQMQWSYDCSSFGDRGNFQVYIYTGDGAMSFDNNGVNQLGSSGSDMDYYHTGGSYYLEVNSECSWHIKVQD